MKTASETSLCFFEDRQSDFFKPLILTRPMDDLRVGIYTIREKWLQALHTTSYHRKLRPELRGIFDSPYEPAATVLWINSRLLPDPCMISRIRSMTKGSMISYSEVPLVLKTDRVTTERWLNQGISTNRFRNISLPEPPLVLHQLWDLLSCNTGEIIRDIGRTAGLSTLESGALPGVNVYGDHPVYCGTGVTIEPGVTFITTSGPVFIGQDAKIMAGSLIRGAAAVCNGSTVRMGAKIYENSTIGPVCKVGGELNSVIFHSYSNKAHDGYAGNSIFGQWCNLGADTTTSNLKNNYKTVRFIDWHSRQERDTGEQFLGTVMSDHGKTGINSMLNTGTNCGVCCNLFSDDYPPKLIPSFSWVSSDRIEPYLFDKAVGTMERTMKRRNVVLSDAYVRLMRTLFEGRVAEAETNQPVDGARVA